MAPRRMLTRSGNKVGKRVGPPPFTQRIGPRGEGAGRSGVIPAIPQTSGDKALPDLKPRDTSARSKVIRMPRVVGSGEFGDPVRDTRIRKRRMPGT